MTIQEAYKKLNETPELKKAAMEALKSGKGDSFLKENGFDLTVDQIKEYFEKPKSGELSREELNMAAGGCGADACEILFSIGTVGVGCVVSYTTQGGVGDKIYDC